jgi:hypothetical protein
VVWWCECALYGRVRVHCACELCGLAARVYLIWVAAQLTKAKSGGIEFDTVGKNVVATIEDRRAKKDKPTTAVTGGSSLVLAGCVPLHFLLTLLDR